MAKDTDCCAVENLEAQIVVHSDDDDDGNEDDYYDDKYENDEDVFRRVGGRTQRGLSSLR